MALAFSLVDTWDDGKRIHVSGTIAATGNYATGGDTVDLRGTGPNGNFGFTRMTKTAQPLTRAWRACSRSCTLQKKFAPARGALDRAEQATTAPGERHRGSQR